MSNKIYLKINKVFDSLSKNSMLNEIKQNPRLFKILIFIINLYYLLYPFIQNYICI